MLLAATALVGGLAAEASEEEGKPYSAHVRWTTYGIPHVQASDWGGLGYGFARDSLCTLAEDVVEATAQLSRFFGPGGGNLQSDFVWALFNSDAATHENFAKLDGDVQELMRGFAAGYNRYLRDTGVSALPGPCRDAPWVREIDEFDMLKVQNKLLLRAGIAAFIDPIVGAAPPVAMAAARCSGTRTFPGSASTVSMGCTSPFRVATTRWGRGSTAPRS
jgi:acyl-homoserine-lactone acylase